MGKSSLFFATVAAVSCGFVAPTFADERGGLDAPSVPTVIADTYTGPVAPRRMEIRQGGGLNAAYAHTSEVLVEAADPAIATPSAAFKTGSTYNEWLKKLLKLAFKEQLGKELPADIEGDFTKVWKELRKENKGHEGGSGPRGSLVFYPDHLAFSNGDGTVIAAESSGAPNPSSAAGSPLGWLEAPKGPGNGGNGGGTSTTGGSGGSGGGTSTGGTGAAGPQAPLPEIDLSKLPGNVKAMVEKANEIDRKQYPYLWGGGHNMAFSGPYDCSGSVSAVLHAGGVLNSPLVAKNFMSWGAPGPGVVTLYASPTHVFMAINGKYFGTTRQNPGGGAGWFESANLAGFTVRHLPLTTDNK